MRSRTIKDLADAKRVLKDLYGTTPEWVGAALDEMGDGALSDAALMWIAQRQLDAEFNFTDSLESR